MLNIFKRQVLVFLAGGIFAVLCFAAINAAMVPVSKSDYCGSKCHEMNTAYQSWVLSTHDGNNNGVSIECIDCHLPPKENYFTHLVAKGYEGGKDIYKHHFGGEYDQDNIRKKVLGHLSSQRCFGCHDDLMAKPSNPAARIAHIASLAKPDEPETRCLACHEDAGHERNNKLFSP